MALSSVAPRGIAERVTSTAGIGSTHATTSIAAAPLTRYPSLMLLMRTFTSYGLGKRHGPNEAGAKPISRLAPDPLPVTSTGARLAWDSG